MLWAGGAGDCEEEVVAEVVGTGVFVEGGAEGGDEGDHVGGLGVVGGEFPADV